VEPQSLLFTGDSVTLRCEVDQSWDGLEFIWITVRTVKTEHYFFIVICCHCTERPKAKVSIKPDQHVFREETVTLRCDIDGEAVTSWQYSWYKDGSVSVFSELQEHTFSPVTESDAGKYSCYGEKRGGPRTSNISDAVTLTVSDFLKPTLTVEPQSSLSTGDSVTLRCEVDQSWDEWEFIWSKDSNTESTEAANKTIDSVKVSDGGEYRCRARRSGLYTNYSEPVTVTIYESPKPKVSIKPDQHVFREETVTLRCDIDGEAVTSWQYSWYKDGSVSVFSELQEHTFWFVRMSDAGNYSCYGAERGGSRTSNISDAVTLTVSGVSPPVFLIVSPSRTQHFTSVSLSLSCKDQSNSDRWRVRRYTDRVGLFDCSSLAIYYLQSAHISSFSVAGVILESPVHPVTEGDTLTLHCLYEHSTPPNLRANFYKDGSIIQNQTTEMIISTLSKSHEGFYYCKHPERGESPKSWISVRGDASILKLLHNHCVFD
uniref:Ig-like domain-containing protein n=1 Tax=Sinocyclocheilus rhinocerous TaxID=307959 RepID=A0A673N9Y9_9TELE